VLGGGSITTSSPVSITNANLAGINYTSNPTLTTTAAATLGPGTYLGASNLTIVAAGFVMSGDTTFQNSALVQTAGTTEIPASTKLASGSLTVQGGVVQDDGTIAATTVLGGGILKGAGTIAGSLTNSNGSTVAPGDSPGTLSVTGNYSQDASSMLNIAVDGTSSGQYSVLSVGGNASVNGIVAFQPGPAYASSAKPGDTIAFLTFGGSRTNQFVTISTNPSLPDQESFTVAYNGAHVLNGVVGNAAQPSVTSVAPQQGPAVGGTTVTINGTDFTNATAVSFGSNSATSFTVDSATQITATAPVGTGIVDITVTTPGGMSAIKAADQYTYVPAPAVTSVSPSAGPESGGTTVTIAGTNFAGATGVKFGTIAATSFAVNSGTRITSVAPAGTGTVDIVVTTPYGTSGTGVADQYTYAAQPTVTGISPSSGATSGGTTVTIAGTGFTNATAVKFGSADASSFTLDSATKITAVAPSHGAATVDVTVTGPGGTSATSSADQFAYQAPPTASIGSPGDNQT
ncbi:MAG TPA: IPT/TIG domain-containing protein, partial [Mycobacterium sp.]|nr:IPT/TIG domain-containing protein [Mycobacterium sp.]